MRQHVVDKSLKQQEDVRLTGAIRMDTQRIDCVIVVPINPVELIFPDLLKVFTSHPAVAVRESFDEHGRRGVIENQLAGISTRSTSLPAFHGTIHSEAFFL